MRFQPNPPTIIDRDEQLDIKAQQLSDICILLESLKNRCLATTVAQQLD